MAFCGALAILLGLADGGGSDAGPRTAPSAATPASTAAVTIQMRSSESLTMALQRAGLDAAEANRVADALADDFDIVNPHPGLLIRLRVARATRPEAPPRLAALELAPRENARLTLSRAGDGTLQLRRLTSAAMSAPSLTGGVVHGSLYLSLVEAGVTADMAATVAGLFGRRLDLTRDIESGDRFRLVFDRRRRADGEPLAATELLYAEIATRSGRIRFYHDREEDAGPGAWVDGDPGGPSAGLLRTPVDGARVTSTFGPRLHPLLGFTRMHQGVDFGAPVGTPVLAAGSGVVEETTWEGGYGRWLKIRHGPGLETGYGHLSAWGHGIAPGSRVRQGQIVAFVGASGLATGPHLHFEVFAAGRRIDPRDTPPLAITPRGPFENPIFQARRARIDSAVASLAAACAASDDRPTTRNTTCVS